MGDKKEEGNGQGSEGRVRKDEGGGGYGKKGRH